MEKKIFYADDEESLREMYEQIHRTYFKDYTLELFEDGKKLEESFLENEDDLALIVTDNNMPKMTGLEFIRKHYSKIPIILCSANLDTSKIQEIESYGVDYVEKPFGLNIFIESIRKNLKF